MYYIILFVGVLSFLGLVAWLAPARRARAGSRATGPHDQAGHAAASLTAQLLRGERNEDKPCLTPIDCVRTKRCAGHCGCH